MGKSSHRPDFCKLSRGGKKTQSFINITESSQKCSFQTLELAEILSKYLQHENYFPNNIKMLFAFPLAVTVFFTIKHSTAGGGVHFYSGKSLWCINNSIRCPHLSIHLLNILCEGKYTQSILTCEKHFCYFSCVQH